MSMLGSEENLQWRQKDEGLNVSLPSNPPSQYANTLKLECEEKSLEK
jgi:hypothetical protein